MYIPSLGLMGIDNYNTCGQQILDIMLQNQQIIRLGDQSEEEPQPIPNPPSPQTEPNIQQQISQQVREQQHNIFQAIQRYLEEHCCIKFLLFVIIILLIVAIYQEKEYLIKKQRTFRFFIEKIQKQKIKKELISETQDKNGQNVVLPQTVITPIVNNENNEVKIKLETAKTKEQESKSQTVITSQDEATMQRVKQLDEKYSSIQGITMSKIVQAARWRKLKQQDILMHSQLSNQEQSYYQQKYKIGHYDELPFCVVVPTFNNADNNRHISNIRSIVMQNYLNYRIILIDDASTDNTGSQVLQYLQNQNKINSSNYVFIHNTDNQGSSANLRKATLQYCKPEQIFMIVDGDDELIGRQVLKLFNAVYQETGAWIVYSNFFTEEGKLGYSKPIPERVTEANDYRKYPFVTSHLRTLYTQLLREIKEEDLKGKDGNYLKVANDVSFMLPCLEMAHRRVIYIPELTYMYNQNTGHNNHQLKLLEQKRNEKLIRQEAPYAILEKLFKETQTKLNIRDQLLGDPQKFQWLKQALKIKNGTKDLGNVSHHISKST